MLEKERMASRDLAVILKELPQEERILAQGIITGMNLARQMRVAEANVEKNPPATV